MSNYTNPYSAGTGNSKLFRIPAILTLKNGRVIACGDIRYGNGTDDPANIETVIRYSDDNCKTWSDIVWVNHFNDMEDADHNQAIPTSASFCDSAICQDNNGVIYHVCDACPAYMGLWSAGTYGKGNGYIDGRLALCDKTSHEKAESTKLDKEHYPYYVAEYNEDGFAPVLRFSDNSSYKSYFVDRFYNIYEKNGEEYSPVLIKQMNKDGSLNDTDVIANIFYAYAPIKIYPTYYLWVRKSFDNGESWSDGKILNLEIGSRGFTGFSPGIGICLEKDGKQRVIFSVYDNNDSREYTSVIYTDDGESWKRSEKANQVGLAGKSSETQFVLMNNNVLRMYSRNIAGYISYCDSADYGETWGEYKLDKEVDIYMLVDTKALYRVGEGRLTHTAEGFHLTGCSDELDYKHPPLCSYSLFSDYFFYEIGDVICIGTPKILYYCFPKGEEDVVAKTRLATEELYKILYENKKK